MLKLGFAVVIFCYLIEMIVYISTFKVIKSIKSNCNINNSSSMIAQLRTTHVLKLIGMIYFIPLVSIVVGLSANTRLGCIAIMITLISIIPITKKLIIPLSELKYISISKQIYGEESSHYELIKNKYGRRM